MNETSAGAEIKTGERPLPIPDRFHPAFVSTLSALLLWFAFPPVDRGYFGWFALVPFLLLIRSGRRPRALYLGAWAGGLAFGALTMAWVGRASGVGMALMALFMSLWWPLFLLTARLGTRRLGLPMIAVAPVCWLGLEYARSLLLSGFPWYYLAHSQYRYLPMIQVSDLAGAWGLSLVMAFANACWADLVPRGDVPRGGGVAKARVLKLAMASGLIVAVAAYGTVRLASSRFRPGPKVALLQTDFPQELGNGPKLAEVLSTIDRLVTIALKAPARPDLIVWPETAYPIGVVRIDPALSEGDFAAMARRIDPRSTPADWRDRRDRGSGELTMLADATAVPMLIGTATYDFGKSVADRYNSAVLFRPGSKEPESYHKQALVPFGEYIPFVEAMPWLLALTPYQDGYVPSLSPGRGPKVFSSNEVRYAPVICFEDTLPGTVRGFFAGDNAGNPPDVLLNLTNDGWFRGTPEHGVHLAISVFRAVECRTPLARAVNTGISALVDGDGRILNTLEAETSGVLSVQVPLDPRGSLYLLAGDWLPAACLLVTLGVVLFGGMRIRQPALLAHPACVG